MGLLPKVFIMNELLEKIKKTRVLRSSCEDSGEGKFRVHLIESDWNEIFRLATKLSENNPKP